MASSGPCHPRQQREVDTGVEVGTKVTVIDQPIKLGWINGEIFMDAHSTQTQSDQIEISGQLEPRLPGSVVDRVVAFAGRRRNGWIGAGSASGHGTARLSDPDHTSGFRI